MVISLYGSSTSSPDQEQKFSVFRCQVAGNGFRLSLVHNVNAGSVE